jgi:EAL domain-containing protein (putative c-di-GMP-specific phosphodiesterase class I)
VTIEIPTYRERLELLDERLRADGHLALVLIDVSDLSQVEHDYGSRAFEQVFATVAAVVAELKARASRAGDILALDDRGGKGLLLFLEGPRRPGTRGPRTGELQAVCDRICDQLELHIAALSSPYLRHDRWLLAVGSSVVFHNPLVMTERVVSRLIGEAWEAVRLHKAQAGVQARSRLQDVLLGDQLATAFQPVVDLQRSGRLGFEALARGPEGPLHEPAALFEAAAAADLVFELDRHCRQRALQAAAGLPAPHLLFVNVVPAAMYDPAFRGPQLMRLLEELGLPPERVVLEVSERYAIESYALFVEALASFTGMGFEIAVDDMGAGYSGLEKIAHLEARYLKFDQELVREIDRSVVKREMARALKGFADRIGSRIIAEGIETEGERQACSELGIDYGQGYLLGMPGPLGSFDPVAAAEPG